MMNYEEIDQYRIIDYMIAVGGDVAVDDIIAFSGAEKLRVYPLIFKMKLDGLITITETNMWGAPTKIRL